MGEPLRRLSSERRQHLGLTYRSLLLISTRSWNGCRTVISGIIRSFGTKVTFSLAHSGGEYNALVSNGQLWLVKIEGPCPRPTFVMGGFKCDLTLYGIDG